MPRRESSWTRVLERYVVFDLFDPPQRAQFRERIVAQSGPLEACGRRRGGIGPHRNPACNTRLPRLQRRMDELGITDPYVAQFEPSDDCTKLQRHRHGDYRFEPLTAGSKEGASAA